MPARRRIGLWVAGVMGVVAVVGGTVYVVSKGRPGPPPKATSTTAALERAAMPELVRLVGEGSSPALAELARRTVTPPDAKPIALSDAEAAQYTDAITGFRTGYLAYNAAGREAAVSIAGRVFQRLTVEPAPKNWAGVLRPAHDVFAAALNDGDLAVRLVALTETARLWSWVPARTLSHGEEDALADWKQGLHGPVVHRLADREPEARVYAVTCLGSLPFDSLAAPALACLDDPRSPAVRKQVLVSFARRPALLTEDAVLRHVSDDEDPTMPEVATLVLKIRGLSDEQISLGSKIFHKKPEVRASVIGLLKNRTDIDPVVWLLQLSRDTDESVRLGAIDALAARMTPQIGQRLAEMATTDVSPAVRKSASRFLPESVKTAALPPLPGAPSLNPKAN